MAYYLGIDGGGTKTCCAIGADGVELGRAFGPASKIARVGEEGSRDSLHNTIRKACKLAEIEARQITHTVIGISGASQPPIADTIRRVVGEIVSGEIEVAGDMVIAREAAFGGVPGLIVIAGTGSIAYGRNDRGQTARAGGWGPSVSDEGSGEWIGREAVRACLRLLDEGESTTLLTAIKDLWHVTTREELVAYVNSGDPVEYSMLFPGVLDAAVNNDVQAREILSEAGTELAQLAKVVIRRLWPGPDQGRIAVCGGVFQNANLVRQVFANFLLAERPGTSILCTPVEPVTGALFLARRALSQAASH